jgi:hypothetical protein
MVSLEISLFREHVTKRYVSLSERSCLPYTMLVLLLRVLALEKLAQAILFRMYLV